MLLRIILLLVIFSLTSSQLLRPLYDSDGDVQVFSSMAEFKEKVVNSDSIWLVQFFRPRNGSCQNFAPVYDLISSIFLGIMPVAAIDVSGKHNEFASEYASDIKVYPSLKLFGAEKGEKGKLVKIKDSQELFDIVLEEIEITIQSRYKTEIAEEEEINNDTPINFDDDNESSDAMSNSKVASLNSNNFEEKVLNNQDVSLVAFIAPWDGHCKKLLVEMEEVSTSIYGEGVSLGVVDATVESELSNQYGVKGFPTIKIFPGGNNTVSSAIDYDGPRHAQQLVDSIFVEVDKSGAQREIPHMINSSIFDELCQGESQTCVLLALPHILESGAKGRNKYIEIMASAAKAVRGRNFNFIWFEGSSQPDLLEGLELTFGFPAVVAISTDKGEYSICRTSYTENNLKKFLTTFTSGRQQTFYIKTIPKIISIERWDGKDGEQYVEEPLDEDWNM